MSLNPSQQSRLATQLQQLEELANELESQPEALLALLRQLEQLHRSVQDGPFRGSLPADRSQLFSLLQSVERSGGWPYIPRLQLRTFMDLLQHEDASDDSLVA
jgi:small-conductance mechanosensitive channel